ncbi:MAG: pyridoxal phosphate-dependent aminotransferase family protein [Planctomycetaceae bacterium]|nr:pyridoxal phosphate-dependent aminotransferase family protein [Planctomycetaceae bacterium]
MDAESKTLNDDASEVAVRQARRKRRRREQQGTDGAVGDLTARLAEERTIRLALMFKERCAETHLKELVIEAADDERRVTVGGRQLYTFGSDSFLGLDRDPRLQQAMARAARAHGTHNGASRAFTTIELCGEAERRLARWLGVQDTLIFPSVTLANAGLIPALAGTGDLLVVDRLAHDSIHQAAKIAAGNGARVEQVYPCCEETLTKLLGQQRLGGCVVAVDGVNSMYGTVLPLREIDEVTRRHGGILYVDDAHGTGVVGTRGRGAAAEVLGSLGNVLMVGSLSKGFSCMGAFVTCTPELKQILKIKSNTFVFGGPVPPPYLAAICAVCDILESPEHEQMLKRLHMLIERLTTGISDLGLHLVGGESPIISVVVGDIELTLEAGKWLFDHGYYVQSATFPAVPINGGLLRMLVNANHSVEAIDGLLEALGEMKRHFDLPSRPAVSR